MLEFLPMYFKTIKYDCNILIPQAPNNANKAAQSTADYVKKVVELVNQLIETEKIDKSRIYIMGTSFGGACVWQGIYDYPDLFAAALSVMGCLIYASEKDISKMKNIPIWIAHSSDDDNVSIENDDYCYEQLMKCNGNVKYTRWEKYGHKMNNKFYSHEPWAQWLFEQHK